MIRAVFWDIGDTLMNEDHLRCCIYQRLHAVLSAEGVEMSLPEMLEEREQCILAGEKSAHYAIARKFLSQERYEIWKQETLRYVAGEGRDTVHPVPGAREALAAVKPRKNGIIADQPRTAVNTLERYGLRDMFNTVALNTEVGISKPDPGLFQWALDSTGVRGEEAVMVGNRYDVDIAPAKSLGMRTILCYLSPERKGWQPQTSIETAYQASLVRRPNWPTKPHDACETPDAVVHSLHEVPSVIDIWG